ncbi:protein-disulfide reductase DsbD domain-containing protein [Singulisphaera acidiphila]|uniref:Uncharacterized protein n=1 Tax=Singulisphaera acidiphila (strain ATCC BAA-1392 / DSM 18658 / VKM B-2454 / MOB10) TaxID=886293 RepID=L0DG86_SINAD|nr:protein-disulfide reductase DsbD domain-containing protein [Singulisphaera acidiphila]AGA28364.1 hypothetical protein Sinac_4157 [Singulisphaera acidiphila DSM 18658]
MRIRWLAVAGMAVLVFASRARSDEPINLRVLYAGDPKNARTADFRSFLEKHFTKVGLADYLSLGQAETKGYDVVILDWPGLPPRDQAGFRHPALDRNYDRPTILIGGGSLGVGRSQQLKLDDMCICLGDAAHDIVATHEIFRRPHQILIDFEERQTPQHYRSWPNGGRLGETMKVWKIQQRGWSLGNPLDLSYMPGMVSDPCGFTDSPDCEFIASGINMKSPEAVAIGRQGNFLLWGFYSPPTDLTPEGRKCFVNAICYIKKFDGQAPLVRKTSRFSARQLALVLASGFKAVSDREWFMNSQPEPLRKDPEKLAELHRTLREMYRGQFPEELRRLFGDDPEQYIKYYRENLEFLRPGPGSGISFVLDEDVKGLGLSNRKVELLDRCIGMLAKGEQPDRALRILKRYTTEDYADAKDWRTWLETYRDRLYFTDVGGFKFMIAPESMRGATGTATDRPEPDSEDPVVACAEVSPGQVQAGESLDLVVRVRMAPNWHIYAADGTSAPGFPTTLKLTLPKGVEPERGWTYPEPSRGIDGQRIYEGTVEFRRKLRVDREAARGSVVVSCEFGYQACDLRSCRLPTKENLEVKVEITERSDTTPSP